MEKEQKYKIRVGKYSLQKVSPAQLQMIHSLICDFFSKEEQIPAAGITGYSHLSPNQILITKDSCFDSLSRELKQNIVLGLEMIHLQKSLIVN